MNRAMSHEAGHAVVGLHFGFEIEGIAVTNRLPLTSISDLDSPERTPGERYMFLAAELPASIFRLATTMRKPWDLIRDLYMREEAA